MNVTYSPANSRPLIILILVFIHLIEPFLKIITFKIKTEFDFLTIFSNVMSIGSFPDLFKFWLLFPIGGIALYMMKKWSYYLFLIIEIYSIYTIISYEKYTWPYVDSAPFTQNILIVAVNVIAIYFLLLPSVRSLFFNPRLRWWERAHRFDVSIPCEIVSDAGGSRIRSTNGMIKNISKGGVFVIFDEEIYKSDKVTLSFVFNKRPFMVTCDVVSYRSFQNHKGIGAKINFNTFADQIFYNLNVFAYYFKKKPSPVPEGK